MIINAAYRTAWIGAVLAVAPWLRAQGEPIRRAQLLENASRLNVTITLDRQEYLPGELAEISISIRNPTTQTLSIPQPFSPEDAGLLLLEKDQRTAEGILPGYSPALLGPDRWQPPGGTPLPEIQIGPGKTIIRNFASWNSSKGNWGRLIYRGTVPTWTGEFRLDYWGAHVEFRVLPSSFERMIRVFVPEWEEILVGAQGQTERRQRRTFVFVLEAEGKHYICLFNRAIPMDLTPVERFHPGPTRRTDMNELSGYHRIAELNKPVSSLAADVEPNGAISHMWESDGQGSKRVAQEEWRFSEDVSRGCLPRKQMKRPMLEDSALVWVCTAPTILATPPRSRPVHAQESPLPHLLVANMCQLTTAPFGTLAPTASGVIGPTESAKRPFAPVRVDTLTAHGSQLRIPPGL